MKTVIRSQVIRSQVVYIVHYMYVGVYNIMPSHIYAYLSTLRHRHSCMHTHAHTVLNLYGCSTGVSTEKATSL